MLAEILLIALLNKEKPEPPTAPEPELIRCTCYTATGNRTASGIVPHEGIIAGRREDIGKVAILYNMDMKIIGYFEIEDTGGRAIRAGESIDVYRDTLDGCQEWIDTHGDYVYCQIIDAKG